MADISNRDVNDPLDRIGKTFGRMIDTVSQGGGIGGAASELYAGGINAVTDVARALGADMSNVPEYTGETAMQFWRGLAGDESATETFKDVAGYKEMQESPIGAVAKVTGEGATAAGETIGELGERITGDTSELGEKISEAIPQKFKDTMAGLGQAAKLGALGQIWGMANSVASHPLTAVQDTMSSITNIDNRRDI